MGLYERDYNNPSKEEFEERDAVILRNTPNPKNPKIRNSSFYREQPKAIRHFESLFPNNYLDIVDLKNETELHFLNQKYLQVVNVLLTMFWQAIHLVVTILYILNLRTPIIK